MTYYKYKAREGIVDWGKIGENLSEGLLKVDEERNAQKAKIDSDFRDFNKQLADAPYGENITQNDWTLQGVNQGVQHLLALNKTLKSGNMSLADYTSQTNSVMDGYNSLFNIVEGYNDEYAKYMEMANKGESSGLMDFVMTELDSYTNFGETGVVISPIDGTVVLAKKNKEGGVSSDPKDFMSVQSLEKRVRSKFDKVNVAGSVESIAKSIAKQFEMEGKGSIALIDDVRNNPEFQSARADYVKSIATTPYQAASVLKDFVGRNPSTKGNYYFTEDMNDASPEAIKLKKANSGLPVPVLTDEQQKVVYKHLDDALGAALDREIELKTPNTSSKSSGAGSKSSGAGSKSSGADWNKGKVAVDDVIKWVLPTGDVKNIKVKNKADIMASSTRADKSSMVKLTVPAQQSGGVMIEKPIQSNVNVQSYFQAEDGGWYALGDIKKDTVNKDEYGDIVPGVESVNVIIPLKAEDYNALNVHYDDGTFKFSHWLNSQGSNAENTQVTNTGSQIDTSKWNEQR